MNLDLSGIVGALATHTVTVQRPHASTFDTNGKASAQTFTTFTARASVQPVTGDDIARLPEGINPTGLVTIYSPTELKVRDRVTVPGRGAYEVERMRPWADSGNYSRAIARSLNSDEPRA
jgi:hypothetical protein